MNFRQAGVGEAERLAEVATDSFLSSFGGLYGQTDLDALLAEKFAAPSQAALLADAGTEVWFAETDAGELLGYLHICRNGLPYGSPRDGEISRLYLLPAAQGRGLGKQLMELAFTRFHAWGVAQVYLGVWEHNHRAQHFYRQFGFRPVSDYFYTVGSHKDHELILGRAL